MLFKECDTRKMEECVDGDFYSVSTPPSSRDNIRQELYDIVVERLKHAFNNVDNNVYFVLETIKNMYYPVNEISNLVENIVNQNIMRNVTNSVHPRTRSFISELNIIPGGSDDDYIRVADELIRDAIANGMLSADISHFRDGTKRVTTKTLGKTMTSQLGENDTINPILQESAERTSKTEDIKKSEPKKKVKKFKIGERYLIYPMNNKKLRREFVVKKTIYSIKDREVNIVIMKQISGPESTTKFTLSKEDCLKYHLKYEDGLQVCSMELDWKLLKSKK